MKIIYFTIYKLLILISYLFLFTLRINIIMGCNNTNINNSGYIPNSGYNCVDEYGCSSVCPDFSIRRNDTKPDFRLQMQDCDGPMDLTDLVLESSMWAKSKLKTSIEDDSTQISFADNVGFYQVSVGDVIIMDRPRSPEKMLVTIINEVSKIITVNRAYDGTNAQPWKKGSPLRIIKFLNADAQTEMLYEDVTEIDGTVNQDGLIESYFIYNWNSADTLLSGCYYFEFKLIKLNESSEVEWIRRFPTDREGFLIKINDTISSET